MQERFNVTTIDKNDHQLKKHQLNPQFEFIKTDLADEEEISNTLNKLTEPADVFVYAAGIREIVPVTDLSIQEWKRIFAVNLMGAFTLSQHLCKLAIQHNRPLCMIYISSISGLYGEPERSAYCASKHGLIGLAKAQAIELAKHNIRVNVIAPGIIETELTRPYQNNPTVMEQLNQNIPLKRWGKPHHISQLVDVMIKNDYLTGSTFVVDGGWTVGKTL